MVRSRVRLCNGDIIVASRLGPNAATSRRLARLPLPRSGIVLPCLFSLTDAIAITSDEACRRAWPIPCQEQNQPPLPAAKRPTNAPEATHDRRGHHRCPAGG